MLQNIVLFFKKPEVSEKDKEINHLQEQIRKLQTELNVRYVNFDHVDQKYVEVAVTEINLIREKHTLLMQELKSLVTAS